MIRICGICLLFFLLTEGFAVGQKKLNFGQSVRQPVDQLPRSKSLQPVGERKAYRPVWGKLSRDNEGNYLLSDGWEMLEGYKLMEKGMSLWDTQARASEWYNAVVPGTVLTTLVEQGVYPDPYYGVNNLLIPDTLCRMDWWYRVSFDMPEDEAESNFLLVLNGINYKAEVWLNGYRLGNMQGAFKRGIFPVSDLLEKKNTLAVHIFPPNNPGIPFEKTKNWFGGNGGALCLDGPTFISSEGWDWIPGIRDRNIGIWQDVKLVRVGNVVMQNPQVITDLPLPDTTYADIIVKVPLKNATTQQQSVVVRGTIDEITFSQAVTLEPSEEKEICFMPADFKQLCLQHPALWWPNGYGTQALYDLKLNVLQDGKPVQQKYIRFGIRELSYGLMAQTSEKEAVRYSYSPTDVGEKGRILFNYKERSSIKTSSSRQVTIPTLEKGAEAYLQREENHSDNPYLTIYVNGKPIYCRGGNWGMDDGMKRVTRERLEPYFRLHKEANFTMIRNWTGESTEELFYTLCDEYGLLVWNDFSISTQDYNLEPLDEELFLANVQDVVTRFRNHPSIAIWCPRNEGYAPDWLESGFQKLVSTVDGTRHYHGNSRDLNLCPSGPWHYIENQLVYLTDRADGFSTELGTLAVPTAETMRKFIPEEDLWPIGDVWYYHDLHYESFDWKSYIRDVENLGENSSQTVEEFCSRAQFMNYNLYRNMFETWNQKLWNDVSGLLLWMSHPAWPSVIWQTYSYDYETPASFYGAKKACEPVHVQWNAVNGKCQIINTTLKNMDNLKVSFCVYDLKGNQLFEKKTVVRSVANQVTDCMDVFLPKGLQEGVLLVRVRLTEGRVRLVSENDYWINLSNPKDFTKLQKKEDAQFVLKLTKPKQVAGGIRLLAEITNQSAEIATGIKLNLRDKQTGKALLPVYVSESYFNLLPGEKKQIGIDIPEELAEMAFYLSAEEWMK